MYLTSIGGNLSRAESFKLFKVRLDVNQLVCSMQNMANLLFLGIRSIVMIL